MSIPQPRRSAGRPTVSWRTEQRWFLIQLALLAKELRLVEADPDEGAIEPTSSKSTDTSTTRPPRSNHGAARFAFYWAHEAKPYVDDETDPAKPMIGFSPFDDKVAGIATHDADITHVRRALDGDFDRYIEGDLRGQRTRHTTDLKTERLTLPGLAVDTAHSIHAVHRALGAYLLPRELMLAQLQDLVSGLLKGAGWPELAPPLFDGLEEMPDLKERFRRVGALYPLTSPAETDA
jgi:hypothetical protein